MTDYKKLLKLPEQATFCEDNKLGELPYLTHQIPKSAKLIVSEIPSGNTSIILHDEPGSYPYFCKADRKGHIYECYGNEQNKTVRQLMDHGGVKKLEKTAAAAKRECNRKKGVNHFKNGLHP